MRFLLYISILTCLFSCGIDKPKIVSEVDLNVNILRSFDTLIVYRDTSLHKAFEIEFSILNKTSSSLSFWLMTCSWDENFIINNDYIRFIGWNCDANYPEIKRLKPYEQLTLRARVLKNDFTRYQYIETTRFGIIFIDASLHKYLDDYENIIGDKSKHEKIIWSNSLDLNQIK